MAVGLDVLWDIPAGYYKWIVDENNTLINYTFPETINAAFPFISNNKKFQKMVLSGKGIMYDNINIQPDTNRIFDEYLVIQLEKNAYLYISVGLAVGDVNKAYAWTNWLEPISTPPEPAIKLTAAAGKILTLNNTILTIK